MRQVPENDSAEKLLVAKTSKAGQMTALVLERESGQHNSTF